MRVLRLLSLVLLGACGGAANAGVRASPPPPEAPAPALTWRIVIDDRLAASEEICWRGFVPESVAPEAAEARRFARLRAPARFDRPAGCVAIDLDLVELATRLDDERTLEAIGDAVYGSFDAWLWRPAVWPKGMRGTLTIERGPETTVALPFRRLGRDTWEVPSNTWSFMARGAIGRFRTVERDAAAARFTIAMLHRGAAGLSPDGLGRWVGRAAEAVARLDGKMPVDRVAVFVLPGGRSRAEAVGFGLAMRGGGPTVALRVSERATDQGLLAPEEWVLVHELSHFWLPPLEPAGMWLSEGFASYYQCVLRSRAGITPEAEAWDELVSGFERGKAQAGRVALAEAERPRYQQIYWGGAAIVLALDARLREPDRGSSLDAVVARVRRALPPDDLEEMAPEALLEAIAREGAIDARGIAARSLAAPFPDAGALLDELGVVRRNGRTSIDEGAPRSEVRRAMTRSVVPPSGDAKEGSRSAPTPRAR